MSAHPASYSDAETKIIERLAHAGLGPSEIARALAEAGYNRTRNGARCHPAYISARQAYRRKSGRHANGELLTQIVEVLRTAGDRWVPAMEIADCVYAAREDGGPETADAVIRVSVFKLRSRLAAQGLVIESRPRGYRLVEAA